MITPERQNMFQTLVDTHRKILYKVCNAYCSHPDDREDLAQEIVLALWHAFDRFDGRAQFSTWMYRIALNVAISFYRRESARKRHVISANDRILVDAATTENPPEEVLVLRRYIDELDPLHRALVLLYLDGYSYQEIAEVLGLSATNVGTKLNRLKQEMKQRFSTTEKVG